MEELAFVTITAEKMPKDVTLLKNALMKAGLDGQYTESEGILYLENKMGNYEFVLTDLSEFKYAASDEIPEFPSGIEINGAFNSPVAALLDLEPIFARAFPDSEFSTAFDD